MGGEPAAPASGEHAQKTSRGSQPHRLRPGKETKQQRAQTLAQANPLVGAAIHQALLDLGGSNPTGGVQTILEALVEVAAPPERMADLFAIGQRRLEQQQELLTIPNPTGYLIGIMRNVAVEGMLKCWNVDQMRAEDEEKHAQALRSAARAAYGVVEQEDDSPAGEESPPAARGYADADPRAAPALEAVEGGPPEVVSAEVSGERRAADARSAAVPTPPEEGMGEEVDETWLESLRSTIHASDGVERRVAMYWGFVHAALRDSPTLSPARKRHLDGIQACAIDPAQPRVLLLLCTGSYSARFIELTLQAEIEDQRGKLLAREFDVIRAVAVPHLPNWAARQ